MDEAVHGCFSYRAFPLMRLLCSSLNGHVHELLHSPHSKSPKALPDCRYSAAQVVMTEGFKRLKPEVGQSSVTNMFLLQTRYLLKPALPE